MPQNADFDLVILGGGIAGAGIARDAALRGARVLLIEKNTFGSGTSSKSSRLIHGGIRYLELSWSAFCRGDFSEGWRNFRFVQSALKECRILESIAPGLIRPLPLLIPIYDTDPRHPFTVYFGAWVYSLLSLLSGGGHRPIIYHGPQAVLRVLPQLRPEGLKGAIQIWDRVTDDRELVRQTIASARKSGAECLEKTSVSGWRTKPDGDFEIVLSGGIFAGERTVHTRTFVNATGPWVDGVRREFGKVERDLVSPIAGAHIMVPKFLPVSAILQARDKRIFFCINLEDTCRIGTTERPCSNPDKVEASENEINYLIESLAFYFPGENLSRQSILSSDAGIRPLHRPAKATSANATSREHAIVRDASGLVNVVGVKLTDHRRAAEDVMDFLLPELQHRNPSISKRSTTATQPL